MAANNLNQITIDNRTLFEKLGRIALPIAIQGVVSGTLGLIDTIMVGFLGEAELAAVGIATQIFFIHYLFLFGFTSGASTFVAQFYGTQDMKNIRKVIGFAMTVAFGVGTFFFVMAFFFTDVILRIYSNDPAIIAMAVPYVKIGTVTFFFLAVSSPLEMAFKATQQTKIPMMISILVFSTNTCLNYVLIFGKFGAPELGIAGAAIATAIARFLAVVLNLSIACSRHSGFAGPVGDFFSWNKELLVRIVHNALPTTGNELFWSIGTSLYVAAFSRIGTTAYASFQAAQSINSIFSFAAFSIGDATLILVGEKLGEGDKEYAYVLGKKLLKVGTIFGVLFGLLVVACAYPLIHLFALSALGKSYGFKILVVYGLTMGLNLYDGINITGILRGGGDTRFAMFAEVGCIWCVAVPLAFSAALWWHLPIYFAVLCVRGNDLVEAAILTRRFISKKWLNTVITGL
jgi:putative MATE family efflux protein